jgi:Domain of unknown function (DUF5134)
MSIPSWFADVFAIVMMVLVAYSAARLILAHVWARRIERDTELAHVAMGLSMAGMLDSNLDIVPNAVWVVIFTGAALWFAGRTTLHRLGGVAAGSANHSLSLVVGSGAMLYMFLAMPSWSGMSDLICGARMIGMTGAGMSPTKLPFLGLALALLLVGQAGVIADRQLFRRAPSRAHVEKPLSESPGSLEAGPMGGAHYSTSVDVLDQVEDECLVRVDGLSPRLGSLCQVLMALIMGYAIFTML